MRNLRLAASAMAVLLMLTALTACGAAQAQGAGKPVETTRVEMPPSYRFDPALIQVAAGATVTWHNSDNFTHAVQVLKEGYTMLNLPPGAEGSITFTEPGTYDYVCTYHGQQMKGRVVVVSRPGQ